jgi:septal ring factor EnvC (AmiA/AmiB activator)
MAEVTNEPMYGVLKEIQGDLATMRDTQKDHTQQFLDLKNQTNGLQGQINAVHAEVIRIEEKVVAMDARLDRIETRLGLVDA